MIRKLITIVLPLLLPIILYFTWVWLARRQAARNGTKAKGPESFRDAPWIWLGIAGLTLLVVTLLATPLIFSDSGTPGTYVPPLYQDGKIITGHYDK
ncbi:MAG: DUF6111 family protein [Proteobacteria bacterium]|nr:DUF6111 family protein [Pseudomonadota bacterium]